MWPHGNCWWQSLAPGKTSCKETTLPEHLVEPWNRTAADIINEGMGKPMRLCRPQRGRYGTGLRGVRLLWHPTFVDMLWTGSLAPFLLCELFESNAATCQWGQSDTHKMKQHMYAVGMLGHVGGFVDQFLRIVGPCWNDFKRFENKVVTTL